MSTFNGFQVYGIYHEEEEDLWFNTEKGTWTDILNGECFFPTYDTAFDYLKEEVGDSAAVIYHINLPQLEQTTEIYPITSHEKATIIGYQVYGIYHEDEDLWFHVEDEELTDELSGECFFPTYDVAQEYLKKQLDDSSLCIYVIEIPQREQTAEYYPVHLPCEINE